MLTMTKFRSQTSSWIPPAPNLPRALWASARGLLRSAAVVMAACWLLLASPAQAQTAPEGNAHPKTQNIDEGGKALANPFGNPSIDLGKAAPVEAKVKFAKELNLEPLRDL